MNSFSNIVGRKQALEANSDTTTELGMRKAEQKTLTPKLTAKVGDAKESDAKEEARGCVTDLLIQGLIGRLPKPDTVWSLEERAKWLRTADSIFGLVYKDNDDEHRQIRIALAAQEPKTAPVRVATDNGRVGPGE